ncbi:oligopeptide ABC transporter permease [Mycoplasmopsis bovigenitalium]|uniref:Oligopeptide ABC transporter permease n=1 Tax=Mycoplasmopsis bovigenitalium TaxID=2112 RepID=A0A449A996_9BACT|nr:ABC transporter permease subunit [Mycoplasmopsis bovigenitalium]VEU60853.1 oligopeptide ABC transporter permease [Mycoplasmopsis bovigenitalium]
MKFFNYIEYLLKNILINFCLILISIFLIHFALGFNLVQNFRIQYSFEYIGKILIFNYGNVELNSQISVSAIFNPYFYTTFAILIIVLILSLVIGFAIAYNLAKSNNKVFKTLNAALTFLSAMPIFIIAPLLVIINKYLFLPSVYIDTFYGNLFNTILSLLTPILILCLLVLPLIISINYPIIYDIVKSEYYLWAKANGLSYKKIFWTILIRNWLSKFIEKIVLIYSYLLTLVLVIERFFYIPGQSFIFQYLKQEKYFNLLMYSILLNIVSIIMIKSASELAIFIFDINKKQRNIYLRRLKWIKNYSK